MTQLKKSSIITKYNDASTGKFRTGQTRGIGSDDYRELMVDLIDSLVSNVDDFQKLTTATGTDTYLIAGGISSYVTGFAVAVLFTNANTGAATLNVNSLGAKAIKKSGATALSSGDIAAGQILLLVYDGTNFQAIGIGTGSGAGTEHWRGAYAGASGFPTAGGSTGGAPQAGDEYYTTNAALEIDFDDGLGPVPINVGTIFKALISTPGQTVANWRQI